MNKQQIAFVHIPRTAGNNFGAILQQNYAKAGIKDFYVDDNEDVATQSIEDFVALPPRQKQSYQVVKGHFSFGFDPALAQASHLTFVREPVNRLVSYYFYALGAKNHYLKQWLLKDRVTIDEFLTSNVSTELDNFQVRMLSGHEFSDRSQKVEQAHLDLAKHNLEHKFRAFGITEEFELSVFYLARVMGWKTPYYQKIGVARNKFGFQGLSEQTQAEVMQLNRFDVELYRFAKALFQQRLEQLGSPFMDQFAHFKRRNRHFLPEKPGIKSRCLQLLYRRMALPQG
ncbi:sulfotransferase family 2 domain-containing protein [Thalassomonas viridans]|uniref:Sulfotransferase family 2 domain-containing protein n=1 Tax=Thalassomonas viridans TaxID=137584 RepID=A0AAF0CFL5_9GAMM|nr:sulfotransferase family 2 domain-containing protein [Thalassomonas viridans]WDE09254.1 sulfotransferase family 2 domain-containing protein [Thalassomonas viridans]